MTFNRLIPSNSISIALFNDDIVERDEVFSCIISLVDTEDIGKILIFQHIATVTIRDSDGMFTIYMYMDSME